MSIDTVIWIVFASIVIVSLVVDLGVFNRKPHAISFKEALIWSCVWVSLALLFNVGIYFWKGSEAAITFLTGYLIEESLSIDNLFVFIMIFSYFKIKPLYQHKILFWGILGAIVMRAIFIFVGIALINRFHWIIYIFGVFLVFTGIRMAFGKEKEIHPDGNIIIRLSKKIFPITHDTGTGKFFTVQNGKRFATPFLLTLIFVEFTDLVFAVDSIPAILAITRDPLIVYTSNIFAILGLRSLYFLLSKVFEKFYYIKYGLGIILTFVGVKMTISSFFKVPVSVTLLVVAVTITMSIVISFLFPPKVKVDVK